MDFGQCKCGPVWCVEGVGEGLGMFGLVTAADRFDCGLRWHYKKFVTGDYLIKTTRKHHFTNTRVTIIKKDRQ